MEYLTGEYYDTLPIAVQEILDQSEGDMDYELCKKQVKQLNDIGWDADYGLDGVIHSVGEQKINELLEHEVNKAIKAIENADEIVSDKLNKSEHASEDFKDAQRLSNALLRAKNMLDLVKYEL